LGVAMDLSHVNTGATITSHLGAASLDGALKGADVVVIPAGVPRKPGMTRDDLFKINAGIVRDLAKSCAEHCPKAIICVISNPVNSLVPIVAEIFKHRGVFDPRRLFGVTTLDAVRAAAFLASVAPLQYRASDTNIPVVGGHSGHTIVPLFSHSKHNLTQSALETLVARVQFGGDEVVAAKDGAGSATLSMAYAGARFVESVLKGLRAEFVVEPSFVRLDPAISGAASVSKLVDGCPYFATSVVLGVNGAEELMSFEPVTDYEQGLIDKAVPELKANIAKGEEFVAASNL